MTHRSIAALCYVAGAYDDAYNHYSMSKSGNEPVEIERGHHMDEYMGDCCLYLGRYREALAHYEAIPSGWESDWAFIKIQHCRIHTIRRQNEEVVSCGDYHFCRLEYEKALHYYLSLRSIEHDDDDDDCDMDGGDNNGNNEISDRLHITAKIAECYFNLKQYREAIVKYSELPKENRVFNVLLRLSDCYASVGEYEKCIETLNECTKVTDGDSLSVHQRIMEALYLCGRIHECIMKCLWTMVRYPGCVDVSESCKKLIAMCENRLQKTDVCDYSSALTTGLLSK
mgnify:CR=1 FL=1